MEKWIFSFREFIKLYRYHDIDILWPIFQKIKKKLGKSAQLQDTFAELVQVKHSPEASDSDIDAIQVYC